MSDCKSMKLTHKQSGPGGNPPGVQTFCPNYQWCTMDSLNPPHSFRAIGSLQFHRITTQGLDPSPFEVCQRKLFYRSWILICLPKCISFMSLISILAWTIWFPTKQKTDSTLAVWFFGFPHGFDKRKHCKLNRQLCHGWSMWKPVQTEEVNPEAEGTEGMGKNGAPKWQFWCGKPWSIIWFGLPNLQTLFILFWEGYCHGIALVGKPSFFLGQILQNKCV